MINRLWQYFSYSDVVAVPFWDILLGHLEKEKNDNKPNDRIM